MWSNVVGKSWQQEFKESGHGLCIRAAGPDERQCSVLFLLFILTRTPEAPGMVAAISRVGLPQFTQRRNFFSSIPGVVSPR